MREVSSDCFVGGVKACAGRGEVGGGQGLTLVPHAR